jgi:predicted RNA-binding protein with PIN domain
MQYWIDGYNLIFKLPDLKGSLEEKRRVVIKELNAQARRLSLEITVVFDAQDPARSLDHICHYDALAIIYTTSHQTADESILQMIANSRTPLDFCIVTSDKDLAHKASLLGAQTLSLANFWKRIKKKQKYGSYVDCRDSPREIARLEKIFEERFLSREEER